MTNKTLLATLLGFGALLCWGFTALLVTFLSKIPPLKILGIAFLFAFALTLLRLFVNNEIKSFKQPLWCWILGVVCLLINQLGYVAAIRLISPDHAEITYYLWPILLVLISNFFDEKFSYLPVISSMLGFIGILILILFGQGNTPLSGPHNSMGYAFAVFSAIAWVSYSIFSRSWSDLPTTFLGLCSGPSAVICLSLHYIFEPSGVVSFAELLHISLLGSLVFGISFWLWDHAVKFGNIKILGVSSFFTPILSVLILIAFNRVSAQIYLALASILVVVGGLISAHHERNNA